MSTSSQQRCSASTGTARRSASSNYCLVMNWQNDGWQLTNGADFSLGLLNCAS